ncbi:hypothetical protein WICMUC_002027 [Wickerhamomyces mucosus]|uniref:Large ribosomal subunit protein bL28m n=1 Tax=Wickerhamomyces mucosus TaxID=1378264 RepID=A0A9P8TEY6_9ASCO|nr:hypothetical protein WICMUC_002027 [Wickerhamomyces mucosus]
MFKTLNFTRSFSTSEPFFKKWENIVKRRVAQRPEYEVGDERPKHIPNRQTTPDYKYGESAFFARGNRGLYGGSFVRSGHHISEFRNKINRFWKPNSHKKQLWSETLNKKLTFQVTSKVLKTIDKEGGLDNYLIKEKSARIKELGPFGWKLRYQVLKKQEEAKNPKHKTAKEITNQADGNKITIFYPDVKVEGVDTPLNIIVGRRKLLKELYDVEKKEKLSDGESLNGKQFHNSFRELPAEQIIERLAFRGYDFKSITVNV